MSCWKQKRTLRHLAWKRWRPLVRPREEQTPGLAVRTAYAPLLSPTSLSLCLRRIQNSAWCGSNKQLRAKPKDKNCNFAECSMLTVLWKLWSHLYSWLSSISPTRIALPFVLEIYVVNMHMYIYVHTHTYMRNEWSLKELRWATRVCLLKISSTAVWKEMKLSKSPFT